MFTATRAMFFLSGIEGSNVASESYHNIRHCYAVSSQPECATSRPEVGYFRSTFYKKEATKKNEENHTRRPRCQQAQEEPKKNLKKKKELLLTSISGCWV